MINLKTAKALGLDVPPTLLGRADEVLATLLLRLLTAASGTRQTYRDVCPFVRFQGEADISRCILTIMPDANDPSRT